MASIQWETESIEPDPQGGPGGQLSVEVVGADAGWAQRFNERAHNERDSVWGGRWGAVQFHEFEGLITVDDLYEGSEEPLRSYLARVADLAGA